MYVNIPDSAIRFSQGKGVAGEGEDEGGEGEGGGDGGGEEGGEVGGEVGGEDVAMVKGL